MQFRAKHGVEPQEAEMVVRNAMPPFPRKHGDEKWTVIGRGVGGRFLQVIYLVDSDKTIFVIHARPINDREKKRLRRSWKP